MITGFAIGMIRLVTNVITDTGKAIYETAATNMQMVPDSQGFLSYQAIDAQGHLHTVLTNFLPFWQNTEWFWQTNWLVFECWLLVFLIIFMVVVSCFTPAPSKEQVEAITFTSDFKKSIRESWGAFDIIGTLVVIGLCAAFYAYFW